MNSMYGKKLGMTRVFDAQGVSIPVTVLDMSPNVVHQVKTQESDGYEAIQVGLGSQLVQRVNRPMTGHLGKAKKGMPAYVAEIRLDSESRKIEKRFAVGDELCVADCFEAGSFVDIVGTSIGKGFAGVIKKHGMKGAQTMSHGTHEYFRHVGSIGCRKFPGRVFKNKRMPGHMGAERVTQMGLKIVQVRPQENLLLVKGSIPGPKKGYVLVQASVKH